MQLYISIGKVHKLIKKLVSKEQLKYFICFAWINAVWKVWASIFVVIVNMQRHEIRQRPRLRGGFFFKPAGWLRYTVGKTKSSSLEALFLTMALIYKGVDGIVYILAVEGLMFFIYSRYFSNII